MVFEVRQGDETTKVLLYIFMACCDSTLAELHSELGGGVVHAPCCKIGYVWLWLVSVVALWG